MVLAEASYLHYTYYSNHKEFLVSKKAWIIFAAVCVALLAGLIYISSKDKIDVSSVDVSKIQPGNEKSGGIADRVFGNANSKVMFIEYGDFQCPGCGAAHPIVKEVTEKYKDHVAFVFRNFPLVSAHPNARVASAAAEAAGLQGKYWEMHDKIYETQDAWSSLTSDKRTDFFANYASELGLDGEKFKTDLADTKVNQKISYDQALGKKAKVDATPTFFLDGQKATDIQSERGGVDKEKLDKAFANALKKKGVELPTTNTQ